ncbi:MAG: hypothetical protein JWM44_4316 [Bacilli bacterium]|nr:hypothetical protein [Bacilli bacterium]
MKLNIVLELLSYMAQREREGWHDELTLLG